MNKKINVKITATNEPSEEALINFTRIVAQLYLDGKIQIDLSGKKPVS